MGGERNEEKPDFQEKGKAKTLKRSAFAQWETFDLER